MSGHIKQTWNSFAEKHGTSHWASWGDKYCISLEIEEIQKHIKDNMLILDVGCANGFAAFEHLKFNPSVSNNGIDFSEKIV